MTTNLYRARGSNAPGAFAEDASARSALETKGEAPLPLIEAGAAVVGSSAYPTRDELAAWAALSSTPNR